MSDILNVFKRYLGLIFVLLVIIFFIAYLSRIDLPSLRESTFNWIYVTIASVLALAFRYLGVYIWKQILLDLGAKTLPSFNSLSYVYAKAWMARYIPGTVTWIAGKVYMASKLGISKSRLAVSSILEGIVQIVAILVVSMFILGFDSRVDIVPYEIKLVMVFLGASLLMLLTPKIFNTIIQRTFTFLRKKTAGKELQINSKAVLRSFFLYTLGAFLSGTAAYFLARGVSVEITVVHYFYVLGSYILAGAVGMATPFLPSGIGVRDGIQFALLSVIVPVEIALLITVVTRIWSAIIDVLFVSVAYLFRNNSSDIGTNRLEAVE